MDRFSQDPFVGPANDDPASQRKSRRDSLLLAASLRVAGMDAVHQVRVRNLSERGLMAELSIPLPQYTDVEIDIRNLGWVRGRVAWVVDGRIGVAFDDPIDPKRARQPVGRTRAPKQIKPVTLFPSR